MTADYGSGSGVELQKIEHRDQCDQAYENERKMKIRDGRVACRPVAQQLSDPQCDCSCSDPQTHRHLLDHAGKRGCGAHLVWGNISEAKRIKTCELH